MLFIIGLAWLSVIEIKADPDRSSNQFSLKRKRAITSPGRGSEILPDFPKHINDNCVCGQANVTPRLSGEAVFPENFYPWMALVKKNGMMACGGTLINDRFVLTSASCVKERSAPLYEVVLGAHNISLIRSSNPTDLSGQPFAVSRKVSLIKTHGSYNPKNPTSPYSIGLLKFSSPVEFTPRISPICLPSLNYYYKDYSGITAGWGATEEDSFSPILRSRRYFTRSCPEVEDIEMCTYYTACSGDGGNPMFLLFDQSYIQIGIMSWGGECLGKDVSTYLPPFIRYIYSKTRGGRYCRNRHGGF